MNGGGEGLDGGVEKVILSTSAEGSRMHWAPTRLDRCDHSHWQKGPGTPFCVPDGDGVTIVALLRTILRFGNGRESSALPGIGMRMGGQEDGDVRVRQLLRDVLLFGILSTFLAPIDSNALAISQRL